MTSANNDSVNELITKHLAGETSADEQKELFSWIGHNEENKRYYNALKKAFDLTNKHFAVGGMEDLNINVDQEWNHFTETIGAKRTRQLSTAQVWLRIAAAVLLIMVTGGILYYYTSPDSTIYQTAGNKETVILPDGSKVILNRYTLLSYDPGFDDKTRTVSLEGEAFFDVEPNASKPFIILTEKATVQVIGTSFNVNAYDSLSEVEVIVRTGIVSLQAKHGVKKVKLVAGEKGIYFKTKEQVFSTVNSDVNFLSWNTERIVFVENDLRSVIETLKKTYHAEITVSVDIPATCIVTVTFDHQSLESVLKVLENTLNLKYSINGNKVEIIEAGC